MKEAVLFDLGNTLVQYFDRPEFPTILEQAILEVRRFLQEVGLLAVSAETMWQKVSEENYEAEDHHVRPLEGRLVRIFRLDPVRATAVAGMMCHSFMLPIFARGRCYEDSLPVLRQLKSKGFKTAIVSNAPWGSPGALWRKELERLGLGEWVDVIAFCTDVGWRKPARPVFEFALEQLQADPHNCLFVGDDPRWDLAGPRALGMEAILIDRHRAMRDTGGDSIQNLHELWGRLQVWQPGEMT